MKRTVSAGDILELAALGAGIAAVLIGTHLLWAGLLVAGAVAAYLAHTWEWPEHSVRRPRWRIVRKR